MAEAFVVAGAAIYGAAANPANWPYALQAIADCFEDAGTILIYGRDDGRFGVITSPALQEMVAEYGRDWSHRDKRAVRARERGYFLTRDVITDRDAVSPEEMRSDPYYTQFLAKHGLGYFAAASVSPAPHVEVALSAQRRSAKLPYTDAELATLDRLALHVEKALRLGIRLIDGELLKESFGDALGRMAMGVFAVDLLGRVVYANDAGRNFLGDGIALIDGQFTVTARSEREALESALACVTSADHGSATERVKPVLVQRQKTNRPL